MTAAMLFVCLAALAGSQAQAQQAGDTHTILIASPVAGCFVWVPLEWLLALPLGWGLPGIFLADISWWVGVLYTRYRNNAWRTSFRMADTAP